MGRTKCEFRALACLSAWRFSQGVCSQASVVITTDSHRRVAFLGKKEEFPSCNAMVHAKNDLPILVS